MEALFTASGVNAQAIIFSETGKKGKWSFYTRSRRQAGRLAAVLSKRPMKGLHLRTKLLGPSDWLHKWKISFKEIPFGKKFRVVPAWKAGRKRPKAGGRIPVSRIPIILETGSSFGSGAHETTRLMIRMIESLEGRFKDFFDIGTGSGILSIAASKLGAGQLWAIDIDRPSAQAAKYNFNLNGCQGGRFFSGPINFLRDKKKFDLVGANMLSSELVKNQKAIASFAGKGGYLIVSGILLSNLRRFRREFKPSRMRCLKTLSSRKWAGMIFKRQ